MEDKRQSIHVLITAGQGPAECCWVVSKLLSYFKESLRKEGYSCEVVERTPGIEPGTLQSTVLLVSGRRAQEKLGEWEGTILWQGKSIYRKFHKRKNWYVGIAFLPAIEEVFLKEREVTYQPFKSSGPGGQHRNKVSTAIRALHAPTGLSATCTSHKSQHQNKKAAFLKLQAVFQEKALKERRQQITDKWLNHLSLERGNPVKVFEGRDFKMTNRS